VDRSALSPTPAAKDLRPPQHRILLLSIADRLLVHLFTGIID